MVNILKRLREKGWRIILWTCRAGAELDVALKQCHSLGLAFDAVNDDIQEVKDRWGSNRSPKPFANIYLDDHAVSPFWEGRYNHLYNPWDRKGFATLMDDINGVLEGGAES